MRTLNPDTLRPASGEELRERQVRTGETSNGRIVFCQPDLTDPGIIQQVPRTSCVATPYLTCLSCPHHQFEYVFEIHREESWVLCPRWKQEAGSGSPNCYTPVELSECHAKLYSFCPQCPNQEELDDILTDKQREGWLERYRKLMKED